MEENNEVETSLDIRCDCGCGFISFHKYTNPGWPEEIMIEIYESSFRSENKGVFSIIRDRIKAVVFILRGKKYLLYDMVITGENIQKLKDFFK